MKNYQFLFRQPFQAIGWQTTEREKETKTRQIKKKNFFCLKIINAIRKTMNVLSCGGGDGPDAFRNSERKKEKQINRFKCHCCGGAHDGPKTGTVQRNC